MVASDEFFAKGWETCIWQEVHVLSLDRPWSAWVVYTDNKKQRKRAQELLRRGWSMKEVQYWFTQTEDATAPALRKVGHRESFQKTRARRAQVADETERRIEMRRNVIKRWIRHHLHVAWNLFLQCIRAQGRARQILQRIRSRILLRQMDHAFHRYVAAVNTAIEQKRKLATIFGRHLADAFHRYAAVVAVIVEQKQKFAKMFGRHRTSQLKPVFQVWIYFVDAAVWQEQKSHTLFRRQSTGLLRGAFQFWIEGRNESLARAQAVLRLLLNRGLRDSFRKWQAIAFERLIPATCDCIMTFDVMAAVNTRVSNLMERQAKVYEAQTAAADEQRRRIIVRNVVQRMRTKSLFKAWTQFVHAVTSFREQRVAMTRILTRMRQQCLFTTFDCWVDFVETEQAEAGNQVIASELLDAVKQAHYKVDEEIERRIHMSRTVVARLMKLQLSKAWMRLVERVQHTRHVCQVLACMFARRRKTSLVRMAFKRWLNAMAAAAEEAMLHAYLAPASQASQCTGCWPPRRNSFSTNKSGPFWREGHWCWAAQHWPGETVSDQAAASPARTKVPMIRQQIDPF